MSTGSVLSIGGAAMLESLSEDLKNCYLQADVCARQAASPTDPATKRQYVEMEKRWLSLARSYEAIHRITLLGRSSANSGRQPSR